MTLTRTLERWQLSAPFGTLVVLLAVHCGLAILMQRAPVVSTAHAWLALALGLWAALHDRPGMILYACAYIAGSEVLWRMTHAVIFWEFAKYAVAVILAVALFRSRRRMAGPPLVYFALLLPSVILTFLALDFDTARQTTSFNLSGPLAVTLCAWYCAGVPRRAVLPFRVLTAAVGPVFGIATLTILATWASGAIRFGRNSNFATSAGFGPNQVSAALSFGALLCFLLFATGRTRDRVRLILAALCLVCVVQSIMTFSRGGLYMLLGGVVCASFCLLRDWRARHLLSTRLPPLAVIAFVCVLPRLNQYTSGALQHRLTDTGLTHRGTFIRLELTAFAEHPIFGAGPGMSRFSHENATSHTEFTRALAEHGLFGLLSTIQLMLLCAASVVRSRSNIGRAFALALVGWAVLFMLTSALRMVAPALAIGLAGIPFRCCDFSTEPAGRLYRARFVELAVRRPRPQLSAAAILVPALHLGRRLNGHLKPKQRLALHAPAPAEPEQDNRG